MLFSIPKMTPSAGIPITVTKEKEDGVVRVVNDAKTFTSIDFDLLQNGPGGTCAQGCLPDQENFEVGGRECIVWYPPEAIHVVAFAQCTCLLFPLRCGGVRASPAAR